MRDDFRIMLPEDNFGTQFQHMMFKDAGTDINLMLQASASKFMNHF